MYSVTIGLSFSHLNSGLPFRPILLFYLFLNKAKESIRKLQYEEYPVYCVVKYEFVQILWPFEIDLKNNLEDVSSLSVKHI